MVLALQSAVVWLSFVNRFIRVAPEYSRHVTPGEEIPWQDILSCLRRHRTPWTARPRLLLSKSVWKIVLTIRL